MGSRPAVCCSRRSSAGSAVRPRPARTGAAPGPGSGSPPGPDPAAMHSGMSSQASPKPNSWANSVAGERRGALAVRRRGRRRSRWGPAAQSDVGELAEGQARELRKAARRSAAWAGVAVGQHRAEGGCRRPAARRAEARRPAGRRSSARPAGLRGGLRQRQPAPDRAVRHPRRRSRIRRRSPAGRSGRDSRRGRGPPGTPRPSAPGSPRQSPSPTRGTAVRERPASSAESGAASTWFPRAHLSSGCELYHDPALRRELVRHGTARRNGESRAAPVGRRQRGPRETGQLMHRGPPRPLPSSEPAIRSTSMPAASSASLVTVFRS